MIKKIFRILICLLSLLFIVWFIAPAVLYRVLNIGNIVGVLICVFLIFRFGTERLYNSFKEKLFKNKVGKVVYRILTVLACICLAYAVIISSLMAFFGIKAPTSPSDNTAVVLGAQVKLFDGAVGEAKYTKVVLEERGLRAPLEAKGEICFLSSDETKLPLLRQLFDFEL